MNFHPFSLHTLLTSIMMSYFVQPDPAFALARSLRVEGGNEV